MEEEMHKLCLKHSKQYPITPKRRLLACKELYNILGLNVVDWRDDCFHTGNTIVMCVKTVTENTIERVDERLNMVDRAIIYYTDFSEMGDDKAASKMLGNIDIVNMSELVKLADNYLAMS